MKRIALIHTVEAVAVSFGKQLQNTLEEPVKIHNLWDEFLASDPNETGIFSVENRKRFYNDLQTAELTGADLIAVTCSTLTPYVKEMRPFLKVPVIAIDDAMGKKAVELGQKIFVLSTADSTVEPTKAKLREEAEKAGKTIAIDNKVVGEAYVALKAMEMEKHDRLLLESARDIHGYDCIVLAQASMAHMEEPIARLCGCPVLSSPRLCMEQIKQTIHQMK